MQHRPLPLSFAMCVFYSTPGLLVINFPISNSSCFYVRLRFIILTRFFFAHFRQVIFLSNLRSSVLKILLVGNFGQVHHFNFLFETSRVRKVGDFPIVLMVMYTLFFFPRRVIVTTRFVPVRVYDI